jgi:DNA-binding transcriptional ArsR family regulator
MRPPTHTQSALRAPLNDILGTEAHVRILRVVATTKVPMSKAAIARRAALNASGVGRAIEELTERGIVESVGTGSRRLYRLREEQPLASLLTNLFAAEQEWFEALIDALRSVAQGLTPPPAAAWIQGSVATETDAPGDPVVVGLLAPARAVDDTVEQMRDAVADVEMAYDVTVAVHGMTAADLAALPPSGRLELLETLPLLGPPPLELLPGGRSDRAQARRRTTHRDHDRWSLTLAVAVAERLSERPELVERARKHIERRLPHASPGERKELEEWARILRTMSMTRLRRFLVEPSERATRLRQSLPFVDALSREELDELRETHA